MLFSTSSSHRSRFVITFFVAITRFFFLQSLVVVVVGGSGVERRFDNGRRISVLEEGVNVTIDRSPKIVGGTFAQSGEFPWFVSVGTEGLCGGTLVWENVVLTAAHCNPVVSGQVRVGGTVAPWGKQPSAMGLIRKIIPKSLVKHPNYSPSSDSWDTMLLEIEPVPTNIKPITLNRNAANPVNNQKVTAVGFGDTFEGSDRGSENLRKVDVFYVPPVECQNDYKGWGKIVPDSMLCADVDQGGKDSCSGDSGGPLVDASQNLVGVTSFGQGCARNGSPGVYARVSGATNWLQSTICQMASSTNKPSWCNDDSNGGTGGSSGGGGSGGGGGSNGGGSTSDDVTVRVKVKYDKHPEEFSWLIKDQSTKRIVVKYNFGFVKKRNALVTADVQLKRGGKYLVSMKDKFGDGVKNGYMDFFAVVGGKEEFVDGLWLEFAKRWNTQVSLPKTFASARGGDTELDTSTAVKRKKKKHWKGKYRRNLR